MVFQHSIRRATPITPLDPSGHLFFPTATTIFLLLLILLDSCSCRRKNKKNLGIRISSSSSSYSLTHYTHTHTHTHRWGIYTVYTWYSIFIIPPSPLTLFVSLCEVDMITINRLEISSPRAGDFFFVCSILIFFLLLLLVFLSLTYFFFVVVVVSYSPTHLCRCD